MAIKTLTKRKRKRKVIRTEHPHIVRIEGVRGGEPVIEGSGISVWIIAGLHIKGDSAETIIRTYPHLPPTGIYDALSYYYDHQPEIDHELDEQQHAHDHPVEFMAKHNFKPDERGFFRYHPSAKVEVAQTKHAKTASAKGMRRNGR